MKKIGIGVDIEDIGRFKNLSLKKDRVFLEKIFSKEELDYSYKKKRYYQHLTARYCAKEAVSKALGEFGESAIDYHDINIINSINGAPRVKIEKVDFLKYDFKLSMSHCSDKAIAFVVAKKKD